MPRPLFECEAVEAEIDRVRSLDVDALRTLWRTTFRSSPPPAFSKDILARFLCWHLQEQAFGGLDAKTAKHLGGPARGGRSRADRSRRLKPGTVFLREYRASGTPSPSLQRAKTAVAVALEILDTEVRWLASTRAMTFTGLKLKASYASIEGACSTRFVGRGRRSTRPTKRVEHAPRQFSMLEPKIGLPILFAGIVSGSDPGANKRSVASR